MLLELAAGLAPSLDHEAISLLYRSVKPLVLDDSSPQLQKRAYKVGFTRVGIAMRTICRHACPYFLAME